MSFLYKKRFVNDTREGVPDANAWLKADGVERAAAERRDLLLHGEPPSTEPQAQAEEWFRNELYAHPVAVDSAFRDTTLYPDANDFTYTFKSIRNVKHIKLLQTELPNTSQVINRYNNNICWRNLEDVTRKVGIVPNCPMSASGSVEIRITVLHGFSIGSTHTIVLTNSTPAEFDGKRVVTAINAQILTFPYVVAHLPPSSFTTVDLGPPLYTVSLDPGNYQNNIQSVAAQMALQMNLVRRLGGTGPFHLFEITANANTNIISCYNIDPVQVATNGLASEANTGNITVTLTNHGFFPGATPIIIGAAPFAGFASETINGDIVVTATTVNTFTYVVNTLANASVVGGGDKIKVGTGLPFKFFFAPEIPYTIETVLGFPPENSSSSGDDITLQGVTYPLLGLASVSATMTRVTTSAGHMLQPCTRRPFASYAPSTGRLTFATAHGITENVSAYVNAGQFQGEYTLSPVKTTILQIVTPLYDRPVATGSPAGYILFGGDKIRLFAVDIHPKPERSPMHGLFFVENITSTTFDIEFALNAITDISAGYIGTPFVSMYLQAHGFNEITSIDVSSANRALVTTKIPHGFVGAIYELVPIASSATLGYLTLTIPTISFVDQNPIDITFAASTSALVGRYVGVLNNIGQIVIRFDADTGTISEAVTVGYGSRTYIADTDSVPRLQGPYNVNTAGITNTSQFQVASTANVSVPGTKGILDVTNEITLYRMTTDIEGIPLSSINGLPHRVRVVDKDNLLIVFPNETTTVVPTGDPPVFPDVTLYNLLRDPEALQGNTTTFRVTDPIYKKVDLSGDNYIYLRIQGIGTVITNNALSDIFCKLQLTMPPDNHIFNSFPAGDATVQRDFTTPLTDLNQLRFELITKAGVPYDMGNMNWSFTFEITELQQFLMSAEKNARLVEK